ncbi:MAG: GC-type dockerin domain-anchored protein [Phycisphaerales bacterium]
MRYSHRAVTAAVAAFCAGSVCSAQLTVVTQFGTTSAVGLGFDHSAGTVWMYPSFGATLNRYSATGTLLGSVPRPGESANDADVEVTDGPLTLAGVPLPDATLLFINGETGVAEVYAIDKATGSVLATLVTNFGASHVVGGSHHPQRGTLFLVQDAVPSGTVNDNLVAEINPATGAVVQSWYTTMALPGFTIDFGDIEVAGNGNILLVSSDETSVGEFTPTGTFVALRALPAGVSSLAGIGVDRASCEWWVIENGGQVARLGGLTGSAVCGTCYANCDGSTSAPVLNVNDFTCFLNKFAAADSYANCDASTTVPVLNVNDFTCFLNAFAAGCS